MELAIGLGVIALVVVLLVRGRRRRTGAPGAPDDVSPWQALDDGNDPTEPA